ncbi:MAG: hypothetical protein JOZ41_19945 [Chloroflexi bacterium]|nr:hypothetical protein [Chloroflexota bacterium]
MSVSEKAARITVDLGDRALYRRLRITAAELDMTVREIVVEAVTYWLDHQEEIEDEFASRLIERRREDSSGEYVPHETVKRMVAEGRERKSH